MAKTEETERTFFIQFFLRRHPFRFDMELWVESKVSMVNSIRVVNCKVCFDVNVLFEASKSFSHISSTEGWTRAEGEA